MRTPRTVAELREAVNHHRPQGEVSEAKGIAVGNCMGCPFLRWIVPVSVCIVSLTTRGTARRVTGAPPERRPSPPGWCPLRKQDHLVTLRVK